MSKPSAPASDPRAEISTPEAEDPLVLAADRPGRYAVGEDLGEGGFGVVRRAVDASLGREVAIKELRLDGDEDRARFIREARLTGQLEHPGVVPVYDVGRRHDSGRLYYAMRVVRGKTLAARLEAAEGRADRLRLITHFLDVCQAVGYAHSQSVLHRDLKPANVMVGDYGETVVLDWGLAKRRGDDAAESISALSPDAVAAPELTVAGSPVGTPAYMSPEQADGRVDDIDERSDVFSLGTILFELLVGQVPFTGDSGFEVMGRIITGERPTVTALEPRAPRELAAICERCLSIEPETRYRSAAELAEEIERYLAGAPVKAYRYPVRERVWRWLVTHQRHLAIGAVAIFVAFIAFVSLLTTVLPRASAGAEDLPLEALRRDPERQRVRALTSSVTVPGNAAVEILGAVNRCICGPAGCKPRCLEEPWLEALSREQWAQLDFDARAAELGPRAEALAPLDRLLSAARLRDYQSIGVTMFPNGGTDGYRISIHNYAAVSALAKAAVFRARHHARTGRARDAIATLEALVQVGDHLEDDITIAARHGVHIKRYAAEALASIHGARGEAQREAAWRDYAALQASRSEALSGVLETLARMEIEEMATILRDRTLVMNIREEALLGLATRASMSNPIRLLFGPYPSERAIIFDETLPEPELRLVQLVASSTTELGLFGRVRWLIAAL